MAAVDAASGPELARSFGPVSLTLFGVGTVVGAGVAPVMPAGQADRNMGEDAVIEAEPVDQPIGGGKVDTALQGAVCGRRDACMDVQGRGSRFDVPRKHTLVGPHKTKLSTIDA